GKSFVAMHLLRSLAELGKKVVLVDADIRASALTGTYGIHTQGCQNGLAHYLVGLCDMDDVVYSTNFENASMVLCGKHVSNSLQLLNSPKFSALLDKLAQTHDLVLVDAPPVGTIIDAAQIARFCDGTIFVVESNLVSRRELADSMRQIEKASCPILGTVLNKFDINSYSAKKHYYKSYYTQYDSSLKSRRRVKPSE
ncbi:MAG TPA: CpsD/CapB family tyrosine-protein kinase, partial [Candidatus Limiplasma sp.]|nr:CpsD/CapB family tyrosine-protein kinase [Candidatus Limiplasma sp.]